MCAVDGEVGGYTDGDHLATGEVEEFCGDCEEGAGEFAVEAEVVYVFYEVVWGAVEGVGAVGCYY